MKRLGYSLQKIGFMLIGAAIMLAVIRVVWNVTAPQASALAAITTLENTPLSENQAEINEITLSPLPLLDDTFVSGIPRQVNLHTTIPDRPRVNVTTCTVQPGDNLFKIAESYGLRPETVLWGTTKRCATTHNSCAPNRNWSFCLLMVFIISGK